MADGRPLVVVRVGRVRTEIGPLEYTVNAKASAPVWNGRVAAGAILAILTLGLGLTSLGMFWRRRQSEHERSYKRIQLRMEQMESQVRQECKQVGNNGDLRRH
jgi:plexin A